MRFKLDENLPIELKLTLQSSGYDAETVADEQLSGSVDPKIASVCQHELRTLMTLDLDFADIRQYPPIDYSGIIVLRPHSQSRRSVLSLAASLLPALSVESPIGALWVVDESGIRIRT